MKRLILTTGGTGGHIFPALAVAESVRALVPDCELLFVGGERGPEGEWARKAGIPFVALPAQGVLGRGLKSAATALWLGRSLFKSWRLLREFKPDVVLGLGGYAGFSCPLAASLTGIATAIHEQNSVPGVTNRVLARRVEIEMSGQFRPGEKADWVPFEAQQVLAGCTGFVWIARMRVRRFMFLSGADSYYRGEGRVRFSLMGIVPVADAAGPDVDRSAAGRLLIESCLIPTAFLPQRGARWRTSDDKRARVSLSVDGHSANITLRFNAGGSLKEAVMRRYHTGKDHEGELVPFGVAVEEEREFNGYVIPSRFRVGWWFGTEDYDEFLRAEIKSARFY